MTENTTSVTTRLRSAKASLETVAEDLAASDERRDLIVDALDDIDAALGSINVARCDATAALEKL